MSKYALDSYGDFDVEQQILATASKKKVELEKQHEVIQNEVSYRCKTIKGYFIRMSWPHKKEYILSILKNITCFETLLKIINYISLLYGKMAAYIDTSPHVRCLSQQILLDHDRTIDEGFIKEIACEDINWIATLTVYQQKQIIMELLTLGGGGLMRKLYIPFVAIYNRKCMAKERIQEENDNKAEMTDLDDIFNDKDLDDSDKYPQDHQLSIEVEKMRKKWDELMDKSRREVFGDTRTGGKEKASKKGDAEKTEKPDKKSKPGAKKQAAADNSKGAKDKKRGGKAQTETVDWIQMLPIWIVKQILDHLDQKTLVDLKKVNNYWSYACDSIIKERQARKFLDENIEKMRNNVDPEILRQFDEDAEALEGFYTPAKKSYNPRVKRLTKLMNRGAILKEMVPTVIESQKVQSSLMTSIPKHRDICTPLDKITVFPRLIKDDLLLYKSYPCYLKDVNILIEVASEIQKQRDTLSYTLSQNLSDAFSMSEANLEDW